MTPRQFATLLLLLSVLTVGTQLVNGQQYATMTNTVTSIQTTTAAIGTQTLTTTTGSALTVFSGPFTLPPTHGVCGIYFFHAFNATSGEVLSGTLTLDNQADVYLMTDTSYQAWSHQVVAGGKCAPPSPVMIQQGKTSYTFNTPIPTNGVYDLVVNNLSHSTVNAQVTLSLATSAPSLVTTTAFSTVTQQILQTMTQTSTSTQAASSGGPDLTTTLVGIIVVIILVAIGFLAMKRRRPAKK